MAAPDMPQPAMAPAPPQNSAECHQPFFAYLAATVDDDSASLDASANHRRRTTGVERRDKCVNKKREEEAVAAENIFLY